MATPRILIEMAKHYQAGCMTFWFLKSLAWFLGKENREHVELAIVDLKRDRKAMALEGRHPLFIQLQIAVGAARCVLPIMWSVIMTLLSQCVGAMDLIRRIIGRG